jgi:uncharacterized protein YkwD
MPAALSAPAARTTMLCLVNAQRAANGRRPLRRNRKLARSARRHSRDMVANRYFAHDSPAGATLRDRVARTGWMRSRRPWAIGENLAWGTSTLAPPAAIMATWMASPGHRRNLLDPRFRVIGIGIAQGVPFTASATGATYTTDFGT